MEQQINKSHIEPKDQESEQTAGLENTNESDILLNLQSSVPSSSDKNNQRSNNATSVPSQIIDDVIRESLANVGRLKQSQESHSEQADYVCADELYGAELNLSPKLDTPVECMSDEGFCVLPRSQSDNLLELQHQIKTHEAVANLSDSPTAVSEVVSAGFLQRNKHLHDEYACAEMDGAYAGMDDSKLYPDSPGRLSQTGTGDDSFDYRDSPGDERVAGIEEEYIQRIAILEQRHYELEDVLSRLTSSLENALVLQQHQQLQKQQEVEDDSIGGMSGINVQSEEETSSPGGVSVQTQTYRKTEAEIKEGMIASQINVQLFMEFQQKIREFASDLNGVLNCSEAAIRHARVVQEWATSVQIMFEQMKDERMKMLDFIDERERNMLVVREQFIAEMQSQGKQLLQIVEELKSCPELLERGENYFRTKVDECSLKKPVEQKIIDHLVERRQNEEQGIILSLSKQSKISELKLFIIHQQSCIQQLQEQNKELKAIIEGLMGPEDLLEGEDLFTDYSGSTSQTGTGTGIGTPNLPGPNSPSVTGTGTPSEPATPDRCPIRQTLAKHTEPLNLVTDVLCCDRGEYLPGASTDGDVAVIQAFEIGPNSDKIDPGERVVFDPLAVPYVREQCQLAEESERRAHAVENLEVEDVTERVCSSPELGETDQDVLILQDGVSAINIQPFLEKCAEEEKLLSELLDSPIEAGDGAAMCGPKTTARVHVSTEDLEFKTNMAEESLTTTHKVENAVN